MKCSGTFVGPLYLVYEQLVTSFRSHTCNDSVSETTSSAPESNIHSTCSADFSYLVNFGGGGVTCLHFASATCCKNISFALRRLSTLLFPFIEPLGTSAMASALTLQTELLLQVASHLESTADIRHLTLTCRKFLPSGRERLYSSVTLNRRREDQLGH